MATFLFEDPLHFLSGAVATVSGDECRCAGCAGDAGLDGAGLSFVGGGGGLITDCGRESGMSAFSSFRDEDPTCICPLAVPNAFRMASSTDCGAVSKLTPRLESRPVWSSAGSVLTECQNYQKKLNIVRVGPCV